MPIWIDRKYILQLSPKLTGFKQKNNNLYNFRCPFCGDSQKNTSKTRGYLYIKNDNFFYRCHNCELGLSLKSFIKQIDEYMFKEYSLELFKENSVHKIPPKPIHKEKTKKEECVLNIPNISSLPKDHFAKQYVINRKIPEENWKLLFFAENFKEFVESVSEKRFPDELIYKTPRLIFPFFNRRSELIYVQGRAFDSYSMRYITVKVKDDVKLFGADRIDISKDILVVEGGIDSLFLNNCIATADSDLTASSQVFDKKKLILIPDRDVRNKQIVSLIEKKFIDNYRVCLLPDLGGKDINEIVLKNNFTSTELSSIIEQNTFDGLKLKLEFGKWRKI